MRTPLAAIALVLLAAAPALAQKAPGTPPPIQPGDRDKLTLRECLGILNGLAALDGQKVVVAAGKPTESVETIPYAFSGKVRDAISHNIFVLSTVQQEAAAANRRIQGEVGKGNPIMNDSKEAAELAARLNEYLERPCRVELDHVRDEDLNLDKNAIPGTVLSTLYKIRDRK